MSTAQTPSVSSVGRISQLDHSTLLKIQAGCNFVNEEVKRLRARFIKQIVLVGAGGIALWVAMEKFGIEIFQIPWTLMMVGWVLAYARAKKELDQSYKGIVVRRVVNALGKGLAYTPESTLTKDQFLSMDLFQKKTERWQSHDEICGGKNEVKYSVHQARASRTEGSGRDSHEVIIFHGMVARLDFNKNFEGHTVVVPQSESGIFGGILGHFSTRHSKQLVQLENPDFAKLFAVYSTNDQQARYILTPKMMELVLHAQTVLGQQLRLCFLQNSVFCTIPQNRDRFAVSLFASAVTPEAVAGDLVEVVGLAERLLDTLELETRIWSRA